MRINEEYPLYETLYDDGTWKLFIPTCFKGEVALASHIKPFGFRGKLFTKAQWPTASRKMVYDNYTRGGTRIYVIQKWVGDEYVGAWQLIFNEELIDFVDKANDENYRVVRREAPEELLRKIVCDNKESIYYNKITLYDIFAKFRNVNDIYLIDEENEFVKNTFSIEGDFYVGVVNGEKKLFGWSDTYGRAKTKLIIPKGIKTLEFGKNKIWVNKDPHAVDNIKTIVVPEGVEVLGSHCFGSFPKLKNIKLPSTLREIREMAFCGGELEEIIIPEGVVRMEKFAIYECGKLKKITLPSTLKEIPAGFICYCDSLETIEYPGKVDWLEKLEYFDDENPFTRGLKNKLDITETLSLSESQLSPEDIAGLGDEELMLNLSEILWEFTNDRERWDHTSRLGYVEEEGWNTVVRDKFGTKCFRLAFGNNGGSQTENNKWEDYLEDISNFVVEYEQRVREVFGPKANVWIINIVFDVADDVYDLVCGVSVGEEFDYFESDEMKEKLLPPEFLYGEGRKPSEKEIEDYKKLLGPSYDESMDPFVEGWIH